MNAWMNDAHTDSSKQRRCNSSPHMFLSYRLCSSHLTLQGDTSEGDLWLCVWMEAKEGEALSHCPLQLIFTQDKASFIRFPARILLVSPKMGGRWWPHNSKWNLDRSEVGCVGRHEEEEREEQEVLGSGRESWTDGWMNREEKRERNTI